MRKLNLLIVEGNIKSENDSFRAAGIKTHAESCQASIGNYYSNTNIDVAVSYTHLTLPTSDLV